MEKGRFNEINLKLWKRDALQLIIEKNTPFNLEMSRNRKLVLEVNSKIDACKKDL